MSNDGKCPIWGTTAKISPCDRDGEHVESPRAGGEYFISGTAIHVINSTSDREKVLLTSWLIKQRRLGTACPEITSYILNDLKNFRATTVQDRADNLLQYLNQKSELIGHVVEFYAIDNSGAQQTADELLAWTDSQQIYEAVTLSEYCQEQSWVDHKVDLRNGKANIKYFIMLKPQGYARLAELEGVILDSTQGFIAMWFDDKMSDAYLNGFEPAIRNCGYDPLRIDGKEHSNKIDDEIIAEIRRSRFVVADFTSEPDKPRGGVYYEAGFAQGLNIPVIWTCRKDNFKYVHFDTRQFNHIIWETPEELYDKLTKRIGAVIGDGPLKK